MLSINFRMKNSKGFFVTIIVALLILLLLGTISTRIIEKRNTSKTNKELIEIKDLTYNRSEFEYNVKNALKDGLDIKIEETQKEDDLQKYADRLLEEILTEYRIPFPTPFPSVCFVPQVTDTEATYVYIVLGISNNFTKNGKTIKYKIPSTYTISDTVVIP